MPELSVIVSWSGQSSHAVALALREWLPEVLPEIKPWVSSEDIAKGTAWFPKLMGQLEKTTFCLTCVTRDNVRAPWIYFEAGAIVGKRFGNEPKVASYLVGVEGKEIGHTPLAQYQYAEATKDETRKLILSINESLPSPFLAKLVEGNFSSKWPSLKRKLDKCISEQLASVPEPPAIASPPLSKIATEILLQAAQDSGNTILTIDTGEGYQVTTNKQDLDFIQNVRDVAAARSAIKELTRLGYIESDDPDGHVHSVTHEGYLAAEKLKAIPPAASGNSPELDDADKIAYLEAWLHHLPEHETQHVITFADVDAECELPPGSAKEFLRQASALTKYWVYRSGNTSFRLRLQNEPLDDKSKSSDQAPPVSPS